MYTQKYIHIHTQTNIYIRIHKSIYTYTSMHKNIYIPIHTRIHKNIYVHISIYIYVFIRHAYVFLPRCQDLNFNIAFMLSLLNSIKII